MTRNFYKKVRNYMISYHLLCFLSVTLSSDDYGSKELNQ